MLFITLKILQLSPQTAWWQLVILFFLSFSGVFYLRYRSGHREDPDGGGRGRPCRGNKKKRFRIFAAIGTAGPPWSQFPPPVSPSAARMPLAQAPVMPREVRRRRRP